MELSPRKLKILASIIDIYITSGDPVGSKLIAEEIGVSSATIRNEMADLIEMGFLLQPHTSAGRIPSERGFREYINSFLGSYSISEKVKNSLESAICSGAYNKEQLIKRTADSLSEETGFMCAVTEPDGSKAKITAVQFVQVSRRTAMLILITSEGSMLTKVFHCDYDLNHDIMRVFFRIFNERVTGKRVNEITLSFIQSLAIGLGDMLALLSPALLAFYETAGETQNVGTVISGQLSLLSFPEFTTSDIKKINETLKKPSKILRSETLKPQRASILLGSETGRQELTNASVISSAYEIAGKPAGSISLIGPMRMDYSKTAAAVSFAANTLGDMLTMLLKEI